jgi:small subunit ribosomal protein S20
MPLIKSAKKRVKTAKKASVRNSKTKRTLKSALKVFAKKPTAKSHSHAESNVDKAVKKGLVHKNKAARTKRKLSAHAKAAGVKHTAVKKAVVKKAAPKKPVAKKKPAAKKK